MSFAGGESYIQIERIRGTRSYKVGAFSLGYHYLINQAGVF
jgi:hypothetical protein